MTAHLLQDGIDELVAIIHAHQLGVRWPAIRRVAGDIAEPWVEGRDAWTRRLLVEAELRVVRLDRVGEPRPIGEYHSGSVLVPEVRIEGIRQSFYGDLRASGEMAKDYLDRCFPRRISTQGPS